MASITSTWSLGGSDNNKGATGSGGLSGAFRFLESLRKSVEASSAFERLSTMSDAQLARHGIDRTDIPRIVYDRYFGGA